MSCFARSFALQLRRKSEKQQEVFIYMEEIRNVLKSALDIEFIRGTISGPRKKEGIRKVKVRPLEKKGDLYFQFESFTKTQAFHENLAPEAAEEKAALYMEEFRQMQIETVSEDITILVSKKGKVTVQRKKKKEAAQKAELSQDRKKRYILEEGIPVPGVYRRYPASAGSGPRADDPGFRMREILSDFCYVLLPA